MFFLYPGSGKLWILTDIGFSLLGEKGGGLSNSRKFAHFPPISKNPPVAPPSQQD